MSDSTLGGINGFVLLNSESVGIGSAGDNGIYVTLTNLDGSAVTLANGSTVAPVLTSEVAYVNIGGNFAFSGIPDGEYAIELPPNVTMVSSSLVDGRFLVAVNASSSSQNTVLDVPTNFPQPTDTASAITGFIYADTNDDGQQDNGETAAAGQQIELVNAGGTVVDVTTANSSGDFSFSALTPGFYTLAAPGINVTQLSPGATISLTSGETFSNVTVGVNQLSISGFDYNDINGDGIQESGETGFAGQVVELVNSSGTVVSSAITNAEGDFSLGGLSAGTYIFGAENGGVENQTITLGGTSLNNITLAGFQYATISGYMYLDENDDGIFQNDPQGTDNDLPLGAQYQGSSVDILNSQGSIAAIATVNGLAEYTVTLAPGTYTLGAANLQDFGPGIASGGTAHTQLNVTSGEIVPVGIGVADGVPIGVYIPNSILVPSIFLDKNFDGSDDGSVDNFPVSSTEPVTVTLLNQNGSIATNLAGVQQILTLTSGSLQAVSNGGVIDVPAAQFTDLAPGYYSVEVSAPGYQSEQSSYTIPASLETGGIPEEPQTTVEDIGLYKIGTGVTISGSVFVQGSTLGIANDTVTLIKNVNGAPVAEQTVETNANGQYTFSGLGTVSNGTYKLDFGTPTGYTATTPVYQVAVNGTGTAGAVTGPSASFTLSTTPAAPSTLGAATTLNIVMIGQSNASNFTGNGYLTLLAQDIEKYLGFNGTTQVVNVIAAPGGADSGSNNFSSAPGTEFGGTALTTDWLTPNNGNEANGFTAGTNIDGQYSDMNAVLTYLAQAETSNPSLSSQPVAILDLHNESDAENPYLNTSIWLDALNFEASSIRAVLGQSAANTPYAFVNAITFPEEAIAPASQAQVDENEQSIRLGMESLSSNASFNAFIAAQISDVDQDWEATGDGGWHLSSASTIVNGVTVGAQFDPQTGDNYDDYTLEQRLALSLADEFASSALPGSAVYSLANTGTLFDDTGPLVTGAATVAGHANELLLTVEQFDATIGFNTTLSADAANGVGWSIRTSATGSNSQLVATATSASIINSNEVLLTFNTIVPSASSGDELFYAWGGERIAQAPTASSTTDGYNGTTYNGENAAIYDSNGEPIYTNAAGVLIGSSQETVATYLTVALGQTVTNPIITTGTLELGVSSTVTGTISFSGTGGELILDGTPPTNTITGFAPGDTIKLAGVPFIPAQDSYTVATAGTLTVDAAGTVYNVDIAGITVGQTGFVLNGDLGITENALCYLRGTQILTPDGEKPIETLMIGDEVITRFGGVQKIKWIGRQSYDPRFIANNPGKLPVRITKGALDGTLPQRDLYISPGHSMLIGDTLVLASALINGITIRQEKAATQIDYFQIEFCTHDCIQAEGAWSETFADAPGLRAQFHNQPEFWALYPDDQTPAALDLCAPRPQAGPALEAVLGPITTRAATSIQLGVLEGSIDICTPTKLAGWARDLQNPLLPIWLDLMVADQVIGTILACDPRDDLRTAGKGNCAFAVTLTTPLSRQEMQTLRLRRPADDADILSPLAHARMA
jgi:hypothetical protein